MANNINRVTITGNLVADPEKRTDKAPVTLRVAVNGRRQVDGKWVEVPNYFRVIVWGKQGDNCLQHLAKGRAIAVDGELRWHSWEKDGAKREAVDIVAQTVQFLDGKPDNDNDAAPDTDAEAEAGNDGDIPF